MKYLGLAYFTPEKFAAMAPDDVKGLVSQCPALDEKIRATGKILVSASLGDLETRCRGQFDARKGCVGVSAVRQQRVEDFADHALACACSWLNHLSC